MKPIYAFMAAALLLSALRASAQQRPPGMGEVIDESQMEALKRRHMQANKVFTGMELPAFTATAQDGRQISNATMKGDVYLLLLWAPDCGCMNPAGLSPMNAIAAAHKDFHVLSILPDTAYMYLLRQRHPEPFKWAVTATYDMSKALRLGNGVPACVLVNRAGFIVKILSPIEIHELSDDAMDGFVKSIEELLMQ